MIDKVMQGRAGKCCRLLDNIHLTALQSVCPKERKHIRNSPSLPMGSEPYTLK